MPPSPPPPLPSLATPLARHALAIAPLAHGRVLIYGGYAGSTTKFGATRGGGFTPNAAYLLRHSTPEAELAAEAAQAAMPARLLAATETEAAAARALAQRPVHRRKGGSDGGGGGATAGAAATPHHRTAPVAQPPVASEAPASEEAGGADGAAASPAAGGDEAPAPADARREITELKRRLRASREEEAAAQAAVARRQREEAALRASLAETRREREAAEEEQHGQVTKLQALALHAEQLAEAEVAARTKLSAAHVVSARTMQKTLEEIERLLRAERKLRAAPRDALVAQLRANADMWAAEARTLASETQLPSGAEGAAEGTAGSPEAAAAAAGAGLAAIDRIFARATMSQRQLLSELDVLRAEIVTRPCPSARCARGAPRRPTVPPPRAAMEAEGARAEAVLATAMRERARRRRR